MQIGINIRIFHQPSSEVILNIVRPGKQKTEKEIDKKDSEINHRRGVESPKKPRREKHSCRHLRTTSGSQARRTVGGGVRDDIIGADVHGVAVIAGRPKRGRSTWSALKPRTAASGGRFRCLFLFLSRCSTTFSGSRVTKDDADIRKEKRREIRNPKEPGA